MTNREQIRALKKRRRGMARGVEANKKTVRYINDKAFREEVRADIARDSRIIKQYDLEISRLKRRR